MRIVHAALLAAVSSMSACIIPVAPDFQDPPSRPDSSPNISSFSPQTFGSTVSVQPGPDGTQFSALVSDPDPGKLYVRWAVDYPKYTTNTWQSGVQIISPAIDGQPIQNAQISQIINCGNVLNTSTSAHTLVLMVADEPFVAPDLSQPYSLEQLQTPGLIAWGYWNINITCKAPQPTTP